jgi:hypothetical protein
MAEETGMIKQRRKPGRPKGVKNSPNGPKEKRKNPYTMTLKAQQRLGVAPMNPEEKEYNSRVIAHAMEVMSISARTEGVKQESDIPAMQEAFIKYLQICEKNGVKPGNQGASAAIGIEYITLYMWSRGSRGEVFQRFAKSILQALSVIREDLVADGKIHPIVGIFWQRNYDGLRNDTEQVQNNTAIDDGQGDEFSSVSEIKKRYGDLLKE